MQALFPVFFLCCFICWPYELSYPEKPALAPAGTRATLAEKLNSLRNGVWEVIVVFSISLGGLFAGWFTPTEAGAVGCAGILLVTYLKGAAYT